MKNVTITLDEALLAWLRAQAGLRGVSVSRFLGDLIYEHMEQARQYHEAMQQFLAEEPFPFGWKEGRRPTREELHDRQQAREDLRVSERQSESSPDETT